MRVSAFALPATGQCGRRRIVCGRPGEPRRGDCKAPMIAALLVQRGCSRNPPISLHAPLLVLGVHQHVSRFMSFRECGGHLDWPPPNNSCEGKK